MIRHITTNIQGAQTTTELEQFNLLIGPNASGKDRIIRAVSLALSGTVDDLLGKDEVAQSAALAPLATDGLISAVAEFEDGKIAEYTLRFKADGTATKPVRNGPSGTVLSLREVRDVFSRNEAAQRAFFLAAGGRIRPVRMEDIEAQFSGVLVEDYRRLAKQVRDSVNEDPLVTLGKVIREAKRLSLEKTREITANEGALSTIGGDARVVLPDELAQYERTRDQITASLASLDTVAAPLDVAPLQRRLERLAERASAAVARIQAASQFFATVPEPPEVPGADGARTFWTALNTVASTYRDGMPCPLSGGVVSEIALQTTRATASNALAQIEQATAARSAWLAESARFAKDRDAAMAEYQTDAQDYQTVQATIAAASQDTTAYQTAQVERARLRDELAKVSEHIARANGAREQAGRLTRIRSEIEEAKITRDTLGRLAESAADVEGRLLTTLIGVVEDAVNANLPTLPNGGKFSARIEDGKFRMGLAASNGLRTALSGAEWNILTLAIGLALANGRPDELHVLIPEDRGYDSDTLCKWMWAVADNKNNRAQVILASTTAPSYPVDGWCYIPLGMERMPPPSGDRATLNVVEVVRKVESAPDVKIAKAPDGYWRAWVDNEMFMENDLGIFASQQGVLDALRRADIHVPTTQAGEMTATLLRGGEAFASLAHKMFPEPSPTEDRVFRMFTTPSGNPNGWSAPISVALPFTERLTVGLTEEQVKDLIRKEYPDIKRLTDKRVAQELATAGLRLENGRVVLLGSTPAEQAVVESVEDFGRASFTGEFEGVVYKVVKDGNRWEGHIYQGDDVWEHVVIGNSPSDAEREVKARITLRNGTLPSSANDPKPEAAETEVAEPEAAKPPVACPFMPVGRFVWQGNYAEVGRALAIFVGSQSRIDTATDGPNRWEKYASGALVYVTPNNAAVWSGTATYRVTSGQVGVV